MTLSLSTLSDRDRRALYILVACAILFAGYRYLFAPTTEAVGGIDSVPLAERRLNSLRAIAAALPAKEDTLKQVEADLGAREKTIPTTGTAAQAQARLLEVARRVGNSNGIEIRGGDFLTPKTLGDAYGEVFAGVAFTCRIDQFVNFFADLSREPDLISPSEITVNTQDQKTKVLSVRMILSGVVPRKLVPEKKGYGL
jgi:Tfp pilus assembly protein PilO